MIKLIDLEFGVEGKYKKMKNKTQKPQQQTNKSTKRNKTYKKNN